MFNNRAFEEEPVEKEPVKKEPGQQPPRDDPAPEDTTPPTGTIDTLAATDDAAGQLLLTWTAPAAPDADPTDYHVNWAKSAEDYPADTAEAGNAHPTGTTPKLLTIPQGRDKPPAPGNPATPHRWQKAGCFHRPPDPVPLRRLPCCSRVLAGGLCPTRRRVSHLQPSRASRQVQLRHQFLGELQGTQFFTLRRCARSCCATAPPSPGPPKTQSCSTAARGSVPAGTRARSGRPSHDPRERQRPSMTPATRAAAAVRATSPTIQPAGPG